MSKFYIVEWDLELGANGSSSSLPLTASELVSFLDSAPQGKDYKVTTLAPAAGTPTSYVPESWDEHRL